MSTVSSENRSTSKISTENSNASNSRPVSEAGNRGESKSSIQEIWSRAHGDNRFSARKSRANKIYRCPPTPDGDYFLEREKSFVLDNIAMSSVERENNLQNPKMGTIIPPYNSQHDRHPRTYFKFACVGKLLQTTQQEKGKGDTSTMGALVDRTWNEGKGARYIQLRNFEFGCGKSWGERAGPGRYFSPIRSSFYVGDPDISFGRHFVSPYSESSSRSSMQSREGATRSSNRTVAVANSRKSAHSNVSNNRSKTAENRRNLSRNIRYKNNGIKY